MSRKIAPIGPLAIGMRWIEGNRPRALVAAGVLIALLALGIGLLLAL